jgi:hypothetical protein
VLIGVVVCEVGCDRDAAAVTTADLYVLYTYGTYEIALAFVGYVRLHFSARQWNDIRTGEINLRFSNFIVLFHDNIINVNPF